jgi:hypothetical protein
MLCFANDELADGNETPTGANTNTGQGIAVAELAHTP